MKRNGFPATAFATFVFIVALAAAWPIEAQDAKSRDAEVMVLRPKGYEIAVMGRNGLVCVVHRLWTAGIDDPEFWNPKRRSPISFNDNYSSGGSP